MKLLRTTGALALSGLAAMFLACGANPPKNAGDAVRPTESRGDEALGQAPALKACEPGPAESFVVDLESNQRSDLELAMKDGLAVVQYDCRSLKILKDCKVKGTYAYAGVTPKEDVVKLSSRDEVAANLPVAGAKLSAGLERGKSIDIALVTVGKQRSTRREAIRDDLEGDCTGATHVVRGAYIGAFALTSGSVGEVHAAVEVFGAAAGGASRAEKQIGRADGDPSVCKQAKSSSATPPEACGAALRVELVPITQVRRDEQAARAAAQAEEQGTVALTCAEGLTNVGGRCVEAEHADLGCFAASDACQAACDRGDGKACNDLASYYNGYRKGADGKDVYDGKLRDQAKNTAFLKRACDASFGNACRTLALQSSGAELVAYLDKGCAGGSGDSCEMLAGEQTDPDKAMAYAQRGCDLGRASACATVAALLARAGKIEEADRLYARGCAAGDFLGSDVCLSWGNLYARGFRTKKDPARAMSAYQKACDLGFFVGCHAVGTMILRGIGVPADPAKARGLFEHGCQPGNASWDACLTLGELLEKGIGGPKDLAKAAEVYERGCAKGACVRAAKLYEKGIDGKPDLDKALALYGKACQQSNTRDACEAVGVLLAKKDKDKARAHYEDICSRMKYDWACDAARKAGAKLPADLKTFPQPTPTAQCITPFVCTDAENAALIKETEAREKGKR